MSDCRLEDFPSKALIQLANLTFLHIKNNKFKSLPSGAFKTLTKLKTVDLSGNPVKTLAADSFSGLENSIMDLYLNHIGLEVFPSAAFEKLKRLERLEVIDNSIANLGEGTFENFQTRSKAFQFYIKANALSEISSKAFDGVKFTFKKIHLDQNGISTLGFLDNVLCTAAFAMCEVGVLDCPIKCDCELYSIIKAETVRIQGKCTSPDELNGKSFLTAFDESDTCKDTQPKCNRAGTIQNSISYVFMTLLLLLGQYVERV